MDGHDSETAPSAPEPTGQDVAATPDVAPAARPLDWWHRSHPTFAAITGFFAGMLLVTAVPGGLIGVLRLALPYDSVQQYLGLIALTLLLPVPLLAVRKTRRFGVFMLIGMVITALVVLGVASLVLYLMVQLDS